MKKHKKFIKDLSQADREKMAQLHEKIIELEKGNIDDMSGEDILNYLDITESEVKELLRHITGHLSSIRDASYSLLAFETLGFSHKERLHLSTYEGTFFPWLKENYTIPDVDIDIGMATIDKLEEYVKEFAVKTNAKNQDGQISMDELDTMTYLKNQGFELNQALYLVLHSEDLVTWVRENYDFTQFDD